MALLTAEDVILPGMTWMDSSGTVAFSATADHDFIVNGLNT